VGEERVRDSVRERERERMCGKKISIDRETERECERLKGKSRLRD